MLHSDFQQLVSGSNNRICLIEKLAMISIFFTKWLHNVLYFWDLNLALNKPHFPYLIILKTFISNTKLPLGGSNFR